MTVMAMEEMRQVGEGTRPPTRTVVLFLKPYGVPSVVAKFQTVCTQLATGLVGTKIRMIVSDTPYEEDHTEERTAFWGKPD